IGRGVAPDRWNKWAPRFGFAWDPFGKGKTSIRGGYGIFFEIPALGTNQTFNSQPYSINYGISAPPSFANPYGAIVAQIPFIAPTTPAQRAAYQFVMPQGLYYTIPAAFTNGYSQQFNLSLEQQLIQNWKLTVAYAGSLGRHLIMDQQLNP